MYTLLAGNSSFCLAGSEEQINFFQQSPKMLKMASESFIHALLLCLGLFLKISHWAPLSSENQNEIDGVVSRSKQLRGRQSHVSTLCDSKLLCFCLLLRQPCFYLIVNHDVVSRIRKLFSPDRKFYAS